MSSPPLPPLLVAEAAGEPAECVRMRVCPAKPHPAINYTLLSWMAGDRSREGEQNPSPPLSDRRPSSRFSFVTSVNRQGRV